MKFLQLITLGFTSLFFAQSTRFVYQVNMKIDSTQPNETKTELAHLDISPKGSTFYSAKNMQRDSIFARMRQTRSFNFDRSQMENLRSQINYVIEKSYPKQEITYKNRIGRDQYAYTEEVKDLVWKILPDTAKIGEYNTQKAETNYGGRTWNTWFTTEIPFQDGPYKFSGLPGLIVKIEDNKGDYSFDLMQTKKIEKPYEIETRGQTIAMKKADYKKIEEKFKKDPISFMQASNNGMRFGRPNTPTPQRNREMENRMREEIKKENNPIELK